MGRGSLSPAPSTCPCPSCGCGPHWAPGMGGAATDCPQLPQELELQEQLAGWPRGEGRESQSSCQSHVTAVGHERVTAGAQGPAAGRDPLRSGQSPSGGCVSSCTTQVTVQDGRGTAAKTARCQLVLAPAGGCLAGTAELTRGLRTHAELVGLLAPADLCHSPPDTWPAGPEGAPSLLHGQRSGLTSWGCGPVRTARLQTHRDPGRAGH